MGETSKVRNIVGRYCHGRGIDVGYGGDAISEQAITVDLERPYNGAPKPAVVCEVGKSPLPFGDGALDYVYSSHLLEDFNRDELRDILKDFVRVLRPGGKLVLVVPDEQKYNAYCARVGSKPKEHHHGYMNLGVLVAEMMYFGGDVVYAAKMLGEGGYNDAIVWRKGG